MSTAKSTSANQIDKGTTELLPDEQMCWYGNLFQISGWLSVGQTREAEPCNSRGLRKGAGMKGPRAVYFDEIRPQVFYIFGRV